MSIVLHSTRKLHQLKKKLSPPPGYSGYVYEINQHQNNNVISYVRVASCHLGVFVFLWGCFGPTWNC